MPDILLEHCLSTHIQLVISGCSFLLFKLSKFCVIFPRLAEHAWTQIEYVAKSIEQIQSICMKVGCLLPGSNIEVIDVEL